jgi:hypothetical protein
MLLRLERHYKAEQAARQAAEAQLAELAALRGSHMNEVESQKASVKQVGGWEGGTRAAGGAVLRCSCGQHRPHAWACAPAG